MINEILLGTEEQVLGTFLQNKGTALVELLDDSHFVFLPETFRGIKRQVTEGQKVNPLTIYDKSDGKELNLGELYELISGVISPAMIETHVNQLRERKARRDAQEKLHLHAARAAEDGVDVYDVIADAVNDLQGIALPGSGTVIETTDAFMNYVKQYDERKANKGKEMTIGMGRFDKLTAGFHKSELTTIAARPGKGKTAFAIQIAAALAKKKYKVLYVSLEMSAEQLVERLIVRFSGLKHQLLRNAEIEKDQWDNIYIAGDEIEQRKFMIDTSIRTVADLRAALINHRPDIIIIDHVGRMQDKGRFENRRVELGSISRKLKLMTLEFGTPIIMLSQLNRDAQNKRPTLAELRESGAIEEDSDNVILIHRLSAEEAVRTYGYTAAEYEAAIEKDRHPSLIIIEKQRNGATKDIMTMFDPSRFMFVEMA